MRDYQADQVEKWSKGYGFDRSPESFAPGNRGNEAVKEHGTSMGQKRQRGFFHKPHT